MKVPLPFSGKNGPEKKRLSWWRAEMRPGSGMGRIPAGMNATRQTSFLLKRLPLCHPPGFSLDKAARQTEKQGRHGPSRRRMLLPEREKRDSAARADNAAFCMPNLPLQRKTS